MTIIVIMILMTIMLMTIITMTINMITTTVALTTNNSDRHGDWYYHVDRNRLLCDDYYHVDNQCSFIKLLL